MLYRLDSLKFANFKFKFANFKIQHLHTPIPPPTFATTKHQNSFVKHKTKSYFNFNQLQIKPTNTKQLYFDQGNFNMGLGHLQKNTKYNFMKNGYLLLLFALLSVKLTAQNKVLFEYDNAGNQIKRTLCLNCDPALGKTSKEIADLQKEDLKQFFSSDVISYYPNPVKQELYLSWDLVSQSQVSAIQIYASSGRLIKNIPKTAQKNNQVLYFQDYPSDIYSVLLLYTNGDQKAIKIIKQ